MVRVDTHTVTLEVECVLAELGMSELVLVKVWPPPYPGIDHMGEPFAPSHLERERRGTMSCATVQLIIYT